MARPFLRLRLIAVAFLLTAAIGRAADGDLPPLALGAHTIQLTESCEQSDAVEMKYRLHSVEDPGPFDISQARFQIVVPKNYRPEEAWGMFLWISPGDAPKIPADWEAVLATRKLLFVGAFQSGNPRNIFDRMRMAVDANVGMRKRCRIDARRVSVSGFSGVSGVASMLGVAFPDRFTGTISLMGGNFYTGLPLENGKRLGIDYKPGERRGAEVGASRDGGPATRVKTGH